jgi:hypothetical protein
MTLTYPPADTLTGTPYQHTEEITVPLGGAGTATLTDHPSPLGVTAVQVPKDAYGATLSKRSEDGTRTIFSTGARALGHYHQDRGRRFEVPIELESGEALSLALSDRAATGTEEVRFRALRPPQLAERKKQIRSAVGAVPEMGFATHAEQVSGATSESRITVPTGSWAFNRIIIATDVLFGRAANIVVTMGGDRNEILDAPLGTRELDLPLLRVRRRMKMRIESPGSAVHVSVLIPLYRSPALLDQAK